jgi:hypothetical protein
MSKTNAVWHAKNRMPKNPTVEERIKWHLEHVLNCDCRPLSGKMLEEINKRGLAIPRPIKELMNDQELKIPEYAAVKSASDYEGLLGYLYGKAGPKAAEIDLPTIKIIAASGNEPPASAQYQNALGALYGVAYSLKMGLKFAKLPKPAGYFDYKVGALESLWWSKDGSDVDISNPETLLWKACLMVPAFVTDDLLVEASKMARDKHPEIDYSVVRLEDLAEGRAVQILHVGPYAAPRTWTGPTIDKLLDYIKAHGLSVNANGHHHEIYLSDPRRTSSEKLKTVVRYPVK